MTQTITTNMPNGVNILTLDNALKAALPGVYLGLRYMTGARQVDIFAVDDITDADRAKGAALLGAHDPSVLDPSQVREQANNASIATLRTAIDGEIAHFAGLAAGDIPTVQALGGEFLRLAHDVARLCQLIEQKIL